MLKQNQEKKGRFISYFLFFANSDKGSKVIWDYFEEEIKKTINEFDIPLLLFIGENLNSLKTKTNVIDNIINSYIFQNAIETQIPKANFEESQKLNEILKELSK